jgi:hypothetical protein
LSEKNTRDVITCGNICIKKWGKELCRILEVYRLGEAIYCALKNGLSRPATCAILTVQEANVVASETPRLPLKKQIVP